MAIVYKKTAKPRSTGTKTAYTEVAKPINKTGKGKVTQKRATPITKSQFNSNTGRAMGYTKTGTDLKTGKKTTTKGTLTPITKSEFNSNTGRVTKQKGKPITTNAGNKLTGNLAKNQRTGSQVSSPITRTMKKASIPKSPVKTGKPSTGGTVTSARSTAKTGSGIASKRMQKTATPLSYAKNPTPPTAPSLKRRGSTLLKPKKNW